MVTNNVKFTTSEDDMILLIISQLKGRESEIFHLIVNSKLTKEISKELDLSTANVSNVLASIRCKFKAYNTNQMLTIVIPAMIRSECQQDLNNLNEAESVG